MARPTTMKGSKFLIQIRTNTEDPAEFVAPCALTTKGINFSAESNDVNVPDCDDPDAPAWTERVVSALSAGLSGSGTLAMESLPVWRAWFLSGEAKQIRAKLDLAAEAGGGYFAMSAVLSGLNIGANTGELATIEVTIASHGEVTWGAAT